MKKLGTSTSGIETSARYKRKRARRRQAEEQAWAAQAGPVLVRIGDREIYVRADRVREDLAKARAMLLRELDGGESVRPGT